MKLKFKTPTTRPESQRADRKGQSVPASLTFVNIERPGQIKSQTTQRRIRRHVMKDIGHSRRLNASTGFESDRAITTRRSLPPHISCYWGDVNVCINFQRLFWAMDMVAEGLLSLALSDSSYEFRERLDFSLEAKSIQEMKQYTESLSLVRGNIGVPASRAGHNAIIGTIICLAVFDMRVRNHERWMMHMKGLDKVVQLVGGVEALESCAPIRQSLFIADVLGSLVVDVPPRFPLPLEASKLFPASKSRPPAPFSVPASSQLLSVDATARAVIDSALNSTSQLASLLNHEWNADKLTLDLLFPVCTLTHQVLSLPRMRTYKDPKQGPREGVLRMTPAGAAAELVRISVLALLSIVITTTSRDNLYCASLRRGQVQELLLHSENIPKAEWEELKLWVMVIQTLMEAGSARLWLLDEIVRVMASLSLQSWNDLMSCLRQVVWVENAAIPEMAKLRSDIEAHLTT